METKRKQSGAILTCWLIPAEPAHRYLTALIGELAARLDAPAFEPHLTVYVTNAENENETELLERATANRRLYRLLISGVDYSSEFTKTVFIQFRPQNDLTALSALFRSASSSQREYKLNPHLSLVYKTLPDETKAEIARSLIFPFHEIIFDCAKAVLSPAKIETREDVEAWRIAATQPLTG